MKEESTISTQATSSPALESKPGVFSRAGKSYIKSILRPILAPSVKASIDSTKSTYKSLFKRIGFTSELLKANQNDPDVSVMQESFDLTMKKWGIETEDQLKNVTRYYKFHFFGAVFAAFLMALYSAGHFYNIVTHASTFVSSGIFTHFMLYACLVFLAVSCFAASAYFWRWQVLKNRRFITFWDWLNT
jgi:hypothetical protein